MISTSHPTANPLSDQQLIFWRHWRPLAAYRTKSRCVVVCPTTIKCRRCQRDVSPLYRNAAIRGQCRRPDHNPSVKLSCTAPPALATDHVHTPMWPTSTAAIRCGVQMSNRYDWPVAANRPTDRTTAKGINKFSIWHRPKDAASCTPNVRATGDETRHVWHNVLNQHSHDLNKIAI